MPHKTPSELFEYLDKLGITYNTISHPAVYSADDLVDWKDIAAGLDCKNLFVENKRKEKYLITMPAFARADLSAIADQLQSGRLSFVKAEHMQEFLGVPPGHATPFTFFNDCAKDVQAVLDEELPKASLLNVHPLTNEASTALSGADLVKFLQACGKEILLVNSKKN
jgi:Ala-tRNA(Pro) deacylase